MDKCLARCEIVYRIGLLASLRRGLVIVSFRISRACSCTRPGMNLWEGLLNPFLTLGILIAVRVGTNLSHLPLGAIAKHPRAAFVVQQPILTGGVARARHESESKSYLFIYPSAWKEHCPRLMRNPFCADAMASQCLNTYTVHTLDRVFARNCFPTPRSHATRCTRTSLPSFRVEWNLSLNTQTARPSRVPA